MQHWRVTAPAALLAVILPAGYAPAQGPDREVEQVRAYLTGKVQVYYRVGGILYGTHHLIDLDYQRSGRYTLAADTARATALDNIQRGGWRDAGRWEVARVGGQVGVRLRSDNGPVAFFPLQVSASGQVRLLGNGLPRGTERFWAVQGWRYRFGIDAGRPPSITINPR